MTGGTCELFFTRLCGAAPTASEFPGWSFPKVQNQLLGQLGAPWLNIERAFRAKGKIARGKVVCFPAMVLMRIAQSRDA